MITITLQNFESDLIAASLTTPVLLDIWAEWCGPCKQLGPVLEQLELEYGGRFTLAKVDADAEPEITGQLSQLFGVRSIPFCVMFVGGQPVDGFVGALPPEKIRAFLDKHVASEAVLEAEHDLDEAEALVEQGDADHALGKLEQALARDPANLEARLELVKLLIERGSVGAAHEVFAPVADQASGPLAHARVAAFAAYLQACETAAQAAAQGRTLADLDAAIATDRRNFAARFERAQLAFAAGQFTQAMDELLEIIMRDKAWSNELARKTYVAILEVMTRPQPKAAPKPGAVAEAKPSLEIAGKAAVVSADPLIDQYRRKLSMALF